MRGILAAIIGSAVIAALLVMPMPKHETHTHWHYGNCNLIITHCNIG